MGRRPRRARAAAALPAVASLVLSGLVSLSLTGCGDDGEAADGDDARLAPASAQARLVEIVSATAAGGTPTATLTPLPDASAVARFGRRFSGPTLGQEVGRVVRTHTPDHDRVLAAAVVSLGCDVPEDVVLEEGPDGVEVEPVEVDDPRPECLAPVTAVAVVDVPA